MMNPPLRSRSRDVARGAAPHAHRIPPRSLDSSAYDTAWVAGLSAPGEPSRPRFPAALDWIAAHQHDDGSWGGALPYRHDRILSTLSAIAPLVRFRGGERERRAVERAQSYIWRHAHELRHEACELVGFELLLPTLARRIAASGVTLPPYLDVYAEERAKKLRMIPADLLYSPRVTWVHSLEFLGEDGDRRKLLSAQGENGSIGSSPAATAYLLEGVEDLPAIRYLEACLSEDGGAAVPVLHPCETFDLMWTAYHRFLGGAPAAEVLPERAFAEIRALIGRGEGVSLSPSFPIPDADDTAVAIVLLAALGETPSIAALRPFERDGCYASFPYERHPSIGVNAHVLDALLAVPRTAEIEATIARVVGFLAEGRSNHTYWFDKWHISPYYATAHAAVVLEQVSGSSAGRATELAATALEWIRETQREDGSWGFYDAATSEETAYALLALGRSRARRRDDDDRLRRGVAYLRAKGGATPASPWPPLWIDKCLYTPPSVVAAAVEAGLRAASASLLA